MNEARTCLTHSRTLFAIPRKNILHITKYSMIRSNRFVCKLFISDGDKYSHIRVQKYLTIVNVNIKLQCNSLLSENKISRTELICRLNQSGNVFISQAKTVRPMFVCFLQPSDCPLKRMTWPLLSSSVDLIHHCNF